MVSLVKEGIENNKKNEEKPYFSETKKTEIL